MAPRGRGLWTMKYMVHIPRPRGAIIICQSLNTFVQIRIDSIMKIIRKFFGGGSFVHDQRTCLIIPTDLSVCECNTISVL